MAPTKTERAGIPEETVTGCNIHHLSPELFHMICVYLEPMEIARMRLLDTTIAAVGLEYLVSQIHLIPKPDSLDNLLAVAEHQLASRYVTSLFYESDLLRSLNRDIWEESIVGRDCTGPLEEIQDPYFASACDRLPRKYN